MTTSSHLTLMQGWVVMACVAVTSAGLSITIRQVVWPVLLHAVFRPAAAGARALRRRCQRPRLVPVSKAQLLLLQAHPEQKKVPWQS